MPLRDPAGGERRSRVIPSQRFKENPVYKLTGLAAILTLAFAGPANASTIFDAGKVAGPRQVIDFSGASPLATPGVTFTADSLSIASGTSFDLGINGHWDSSASFLSFGAAGNTTLTISFNGLTTRSFGADWSLYEQEGDQRTLTVMAFDKTGHLLESFTTARDGVDVDDNLLAGTTNASFFQGIRRKQADIATITITGERIVMDNFTYTAAVPEPEGYAMLLAGLGIMGAVARRRGDR